MKKAGTSKTRGPRTGKPDTRGTILAAARARFVAQGYDRTTLREIAGDAGVDVALVSYFFGSKDGVFAAAMALAVNPADLVAGLLEGGTEDLGVRLATAFLAIYDNPESGMVGMLRSAATHDEAAAMLRGFIEREVLGPIAQAIDAPNPELRAALTGSQLVGLAMARYIVRVEPIASADSGTLVAAIAPTLQRYLTGVVAT
jgi:AcrR family transcriptional regulator